jgi:hypothetical protein
MNNDICPLCSARYKKLEKEINISLDKDINLEGDSAHFLDELEELRLVLKSLLRKELLEEIDNLSSILNKEPKQTKMFSWFIRNSNLGIECKFAQSALKQFKDYRLDKVRDSLIKCAKLLKEEGK